MISIEEVDEKDELKKIHLKLFEKLNKNQFLKFLQKSELGNHFFLKVLVNLFLYSKEFKCIIHITFS